MVRSTETSWSRVLLGDHWENLEHRRQQPALVHPGPVVDHNLLGPQLSLLMLKLPHTPRTLQNKLTAAARLLTIIVVFSWLHPDSDCWCVIVNTYQALQQVTSLRQSQWRTAALLSDTPAQMMFSYLITALVLRQQCLTRCVTLNNSCWRSTCVMDGET